MAETGSFLINNDVLKKYCGKEPNIVIPDSVTNIGDWAFSNCTSLKSITIPDGVTSIGDSAFEGCTDLISITIPDSVTILEKVFFVTAIE